MKLKSLLTAAFIFPKIPPDPEIYKESDQRKRVMRISSGNTLLQLGQYVLEEDIKKLRADV